MNKIFITYCASLALILAASAFPAAAQTGGTISNSTTLQTPGVSINSDAALYDSIRGKKWNDLADRDRDSLLRGEASDWDKLNQLQRNSTIDRVRSRWDRMTESERTDFYRTTTQRNNSTISSPSGSATTSTGGSISPGTVGVGGSMTPGANSAGGNMTPGANSVGKSPYDTRGTTGGRTDNNFRTTVPTGNTGAAAPQGQGTGKTQGTGGTQR